MEGRPNKSRAQNHHHCPALGCTACSHGILCVCYASSESTGATKSGAIFPRNFRFNSAPRYLWTKYVTNLLTSRTGVMVALVIRWCPECPVTSRRPIDQFVQFKSSGIFIMFHWISRHVVILLSYRRFCASTAILYSWSVHNLFAVGHVSRINESQASSTCREIIVPPDTFSPLLSIHPAVYLLLLTSPSHPPPVVSY